jgi:hypothetical protein
VVWERSFHWTGDELRVVAEPFALSGALGATIIDRVELTASGAVAVTAHDGRPPSTA